MVGVWKCFKNRSWTQTGNDLRNSKQSAQGSHQDFAGKIKFKRHRFVLDAL